MKKFLTCVFAIGFSIASSSLAANAADKDPLHISVSLKDQRLKVFRAGEEILSSNISSGKRGHSTPTGIFSILQKNRHHRSNIYSNAPMPFMQRLTWSGIALHASNSVPRRPASHGCVRMPHGFAGQLFKLNTNGAHVIIEDNPVAPQKIVHSFLFQPIKTVSTNAKNDDWTNWYIDEVNSGTVVPKPQYPSRIFITRRTHKDDLFDVQRLLNKLGYEAGDVDGLMGPQTWSAITAFQKASGFDENGKIDNAFLDLLYEKASEQRPQNGKILVRQHHKPVYEAEVTIEDSHLALGSHLITTTGFDKKSLKTEWLAVTLNDRIHAKIHLRNDNNLDVSTGRRSVNDALDRIELSDEVRTQISKLITPGSSITISDNGLSIETGAKGTDFIVLTKPDSNISTIAGDTTSSNRS